MKVALSIEVTDEQRKELASRIAGKPVNRLATREEVREFVSGALATLVRVPQEGSRTSATDDYMETIERLRAEGKSEGYIRGWLAADRKIRAS